VDCPARTTTHSVFLRNFCAAILLANVLLYSQCAVKHPPSNEEIRKQALQKVDLTGTWKALGATAGPIQDNWLASFDDQQLTLVVNEALANNLDLQAAAIRVEESALSVNLAKSYLRPTVSVMGTGGLKAGGGDSSSALQGIFLGASWEPDIWGKFRYAKNAELAMYESSQSDFDFARQSLAATTAKNWFTATETYLQMQIAEEMVRSSQDLVSMAEDRWKIGIGSEQDVAISRAALGSFQDTSKQVKLAHEQTLRGLELLLGRYPSAELQARHDLPKFPGPVPVGMPLQMLERRPDMIAAERRVAAAFNRIGEAKAARLPNITLNASLGVLSSQVIQLKQDFSNPTGGLGARLFAPIYQGGALKTNVQIRTAQQDEAMVVYASMALRALGDVENAIATSQTLEEREQILEQVVIDSQRALELAQTAYRVGQQDLRSVEQRLLDLDSARLTLLRVQSERLTQRVNLYLVLGGRFEPPITESTQTNSTGK
jgi:outer membrane protein, multidrug efflux system